MNIFVFYIVTVNFRDKIDCFHSFYGAIFTQHLLILLSNDAQLNYFLSYHVPFPCHSDFTLYFAIFHRVFALTFWIRRCFGRVEPAAP